MWSYMIYTCAWHHDCACACVHTVRSNQDRHPQLLPDTRLKRGAKLRVIIKPCCRKSFLIIKNDCIKNDVLRQVHGEESRRFSIKPDPFKFPSQFTSPKAERERMRSHCLAYLENTRSKVVVRPLSWLQFADEATCWILYRSAIGT